MHKILLIAITLFSFFTGTAQDSLPALHTLKEKQIDLITPSFEDQTITVKMKDGSMYTYHREDWDYEDYYPSAGPKIKEAIKNVKMTFTRAEHAPEFPGGDEAWDKYIKDFCEHHKDVIPKDAAVEITIQFIVHVKGQVTDFVIMLNPTGSYLGEYAIQAVKEGPAWIPATQNGHKVVCYRKLVVKFGL